MSFSFLNALISIRVSFNVYYQTDFIISHLSVIFTDSKKVKIKDITIAWYHLACTVWFLEASKLQLRSGSPIGRPVSKPMKSMKVLSLTLVIPGFQQVIVFKSLGCSHTHSRWPLIKSMFHVLHSHDLVFEQAATLSFFFLAMLYFYLKYQPLFLCSGKEILCMCVCIYI